jgi:hypothetical protein
MLVRGRRHRPDDDPDRTEENKSAHDERPRQGPTFPRGTFVTLYLAMLSVNDAIRLTCLAE